MERLFIRQKHLTSTAISQFHIPTTRVTKSQLNQIFSTALADLKHQKQLYKDYKLIWKKFIGQKSQNHISRSIKSTIRHIG